MTWSEVVADKSLRNLIYKIELDEWGNIVMRPSSNKHSLVKAAVLLDLDRRKEVGTIFPNCVIETPKGVKVADVIWASPTFMTRNQVETPYRAAPELCLDIISDSRVEMAQKRDLYFAGGAKEAWTCSVEGHVTFYNHGGETAISDLFPDFPKIVETGLPNT